MKTAALVLAVWGFLPASPRTARAADNATPSPTPIPAPTPKPAAVAERTLPGWYSRLTPPIPGQFPPMPPGEAFYKFGWSGITAARGRLRFSRAGTGVERLEFDVHTLGIARLLWRLDARAFSLCDSATLRPIRLRQAEQYRGGTSLNLQEFGPEGVLHSKGDSPGPIPPGFFTEAPVGKDRMRALTGKRAKQFKFPNLFDLHSALLFVRSQPLKKGDEIRLAVYQDNSPYLATVRVAGRESVTVPAGTFPAIRLELRLQWFDDKFRLHPHKRFSRAQGWISDDPKRLILKLEAEVFVGSVWAELTRLKF